MGKDKIEHDDTLNITCPYCGYEDRNSWESDDQGEDICKNCEMEYRYFREVTVRYSTEKIN